MKVVKLNQYSKKAGYYSLKLGENLEIRLRQKRQMKQVIVLINQDLSLKLHKVNLLFIEIFTQYRLSWFYFNHNKSSMSNTMRQLDERCHILLAEIASILNKIVNESGAVNGNVLIFHYFDLCCRKLKEIVEILQNVNENKSYATVKYKFLIVLNQIDDLETALKYDLKKLLVEETKNYKEAQIIDSELLLNENAV